MKKFKKRTIFSAAAAAFMLLAGGVPAGENNNNPTDGRYKSYDGLIMTGYQGWFNCDGDGANNKWRHYSRKGVFVPGQCCIDFWPDMTEYTVKYKTPFEFPDGSPAYVFSAYDASTIQLHFKWMADYGIDGAFMQRFIHSMADPGIKNHYNKVFESAVTAAISNGRAISIRYDLTSMRPGDSKILLSDLDELCGAYHFFDRAKCPAFLYHNGKPLIAVGGVGFREDVAGKDAGNLDEAEIIIAALKARGYSVMMRVPANWRGFAGNSVVDDPHDKIQFHAIIKTCDIVMPWHVGAYRENTYATSGWAQRIADDIAWCKSNGVDYVPVNYPGFSRANLRSGEDGSFRPRNKGSFFWLQASSAMKAGAKRLFLAQFDEMNEGTQFFKCVQTVPVGASPFIGYEKEVEPDHYLWLAGKAGEMLRGEIPFSATMPER